MILKTKKDLILDRTNMLKLYKKELQHNNLVDPKNKKKNFKQFKQLCGDRNHDAIAGYFETKSGLFRWAI